MMVAVMADAAMGAMALALILYFASQDKCQYSVDGVTARPKNVTFAPSRARVFAKPVKAILHEL
jgi:hypothetical protein